MDDVLLQALTLLAGLGGGLYLGLVVWPRVQEWRNR